MSETHPSGPPGAGSPGPVPVTGRLDDPAIADWVARYERAWSSNDPDDIRALFTDDAEYRGSSRFHDPAIGVDAIVELWLSHRDPPGWSFRWHPVARDGDLVVIEGETDYDDDNDYSNLWLVRLRGDRASSFTEWWMVRPDAE